MQVKKSVKEEAYNENQAKENQAKEKQVKNNQTNKSQNLIITCMEEICNDIKHDIEKIGEDTKTIVLQFVI